MSIIEKLTLWQACGSTLTVLVGIVGFFFLNRQISCIKAGLSRDAMESLYKRTYDIHKVFVDKPELRPYFYDNKPISESDACYGQVMTVAEMLIDFYEGVSLQREHMPNDLVKAWCEYCKDICVTSPALQKYLQIKQQWYSEELLRELLFGAIVKATPKSQEPVEIRPVR